jgi:hypothetical protein
MTTKIKPSVLADTAVSAGTYGGTTQHAVYTVDQQGRITYASNATPSIANTQITGLITSGQIATVANTQVTGVMTSAQIATVANTQITGVITSSQLAAGAANTNIGYTPYNATNPAGYLTGITSGQVTGALGYTPYNSTNPNGYVTSSGSVSTATNATNILGNSQSYSSGGRSLSTTYTNSTGKPIHVWWSSESSGYDMTAQAYVDGNIAARTHSDTFMRIQLNFIVPIGSTYYINSNSSNNYWFELR